MTEFNMHIDSRVAFKYWVLLDGGYEYCSSPADSNMDLHADRRLSASYVMSVAGLKCREA